MKAILFAATLLMTISIYGQSPQQINILRYNDNFSQVKKDTAKKGWNKIKHMPLGRNANISFGGEWREQYQYFDNSNFGDAPPGTQKTTVGQLWHRVMVHSNIEIGKRVRLFTQLNSTFRFFNPNPLTPEIDENRLSLHQAFMDYQITDKWLIRIGRQEQSYGNNRLLTFREGPNTRLSFDAAVLKYKDAYRKIDLLAVTPVVSKQYAFDDQSFKEFVVGVYGTEQLVAKKLMLDYYFLNFSSDTRKYNFATGKENRNSFGMRLFSQQPLFNYELETTYQLGKFAGKKIRALGISTDMNYKLNVQKNIVLGIAANYFSGDKNRNDNTLNTYNLIFSKPSYGLAAPIGSSNIINVNPYLRIEPVKHLRLYLGVYLMQRQSDQDGTYSPGMAQVRPSPANLFSTSQKKIGTQYAFESSYEVNRHFTIAADIAFFKSGAYVQKTGKGKDITYLAFKAGFKF